MFLLRKILLFILKIFQPELYKKDLVRQSSNDSSGGELEYCGKLHFALRYDKEVDGLVVKVSLQKFLLKCVKKNIILSTSLHFT